MVAVQAFLAFGSNLGKRRKTIKSAVSQLSKTDGITNIKLSPFVESAALTESGVDDSAPAYINAVASIETTLRPKALLAAVRKVETDHGRVRLERWGSRTLDIDILTYGNEIRSSKDLTIPHPRAFERAFVMVPWALLDPKAILPGHGSVAELAAEIDTQVKVVR